MLGFVGISLSANEPTGLNTKQNTLNINDNFKNIKGEPTSQNTETATRVVLVTQVIPDEINIGYQKLSNAIVLRINGQEIRRLKDVDKAFLNPETEFHRIDFLPGSDRLSVILPVADLKQSNQRIKNNFRIPKLQSY